MKILRYLIIVLPLLISSCAHPPLNLESNNSRLYRVLDKGGDLSWFAPEIIIMNPEKNYNLPGSPSADYRKGKELIYVDTKKPALYGEKRNFITSRGKFTNLIYRVHFTRTPNGHLGKGNNVGLIFIVTLDKDGKPLLFTSLHTCGCYLAFVPTSFLPGDFYPENRPKKRQRVHSESLPYILDYGKGDYKNFSIRVIKRDGNHRVADIFLADKSLGSDLRIVKTELKEMSSLEKLELGKGETTSFYETREGGEKGFVKGSRKIYERMFMSWWALDWRVGQDKKFGMNRKDGPVFYTSIKPWAREESDMRDFGSFLNYWGWNF